MSAMLRGLRAPHVAGALRQRQLLLSRDALSPALSRFASTAAKAGAEGSSSAEALAAPAASSNAASEVAAASGEATAELALRTVPVPILVGPAPPDTTGAVIASTGSDAAQVLAEAAVVAGPVVKPATAGGFFFHYPMTLCEYGLQSLHDATGLPWYATIPLFTLCARATLFPLTVFSSRSVARMALIKPQMDELSTAMQEANKRGTDAGMKEAEKHRVSLQKLLAKHGVKPWMTMVGGLGQLPVWMTFFFTLRHMTREGAQLGFETGGLAWFGDLTVQDPYYALPVLCGASMYGMVSLGDPGQASGSDAAQDERAKMMRNVMKGAAVLMVPMTYWFQSGIFIYWITTNSIGMVQTVALRQPPIRALVGMPALPGASSQGLLGMTPTEAARLAPNTNLSLAGSQPVAAPVAAPRPKGKGGKRKKRKR